VISVLRPHQHSIGYTGDGIKVTSTVASHLTLNISDTVRDRGLVPKDYQ